MLTNASHVNMPHSLHLALHKVVRDTASVFSSSTASSSPACVSSSFSLDPDSPVSLVVDSKSSANRLETAALLFFTRLDFFRRSVFKYDTHLRNVLGVMATSPMIAGRPRGRLGAEEELEGVSEFDDVDVPLR